MFSSYRVIVVTATLAPDLTQTSQGAGSAPEIDSNPNPAPVTLASDAGLNQTIDFGYVSPCTAQVGDFVWYDVNMNGIQNTGETGIDGVLVYLKDAHGTSIATTSTMGGGNYLFTGLCAGSYGLQVIPQGGMFLTSVHAGSNPVLDSEPTMVSFAVPTDSTSDRSFDFGFTLGSPIPQLPSVVLPITMIIGILGAVLLIQRTKEN